MKNGTRPAITVAICTFNGEAFLRQQIDSILGQTLLPDEIVVADDGSKDATHAIIAEAARLSPVPIRVLPRTSHLGVTANFERALHASTGDLVALSDQDDIWHPNRMAAAAAAFGSDPELLMLHSDARLVDAGGIDLGHSLLDSLRVDPSERARLMAGVGFTDYLRRNLATGATMTIRRTLLASTSPFPFGWVHDEWLAIVASSLGGARLDPETRIDYRQHGSNTIGVGSPRTLARLGRAMVPRADRYRRLAERSAILVERLAGLRVAPEVLEVARRKAAFESRRANYPDARLLRVPDVLREWAAGAYRELSSQRNADVVRDILQPR